MNTPLGDPKVMAVIEANHKTLIMKITPYFFWCYYSRRTREDTPHTHTQTNTHAETDFREPGGSPVKIR